MDDTQGTAQPKKKEIEDIEAKVKAEAEKFREKELREEYARLNKKNHPHRCTVKFALISLVLGAIIGGGAVLWIQSSKPETSNKETSISVVFDRVMTQNELTTASQKYQIVEKVEDANRLGDFIDIPFTTNSYWYRYVGTLKASIDLSKAELISQEGNTITISLEQPYISSNTPDMNESGVLEENNNILNPIHLKDVDEYRKQCTEKAEGEAREGSLFSDARANTESDLAQLFSVALGEDYEIHVQWKDAGE